MGRTARFRVTDTDKGWLVNVPASTSDTGKRVQRYFPTRAKADEFAKGLKSNYKEYGEQARTLSPGLSEDATAAMLLLAPMSVSLKDAARFYALHHDLKSKAPTMAKAWAEASSMRKNLSNRYIAALKSWDKRLPADFMAMNIVDLSQAEISDALTKITKGPTAWKTGLRIISAVLGDQVKKGTLKENPCARVSVPKTKNDDEVTYYEVPQLKALFAACKDYEDGLDKECSACAVPFAFLAFAGLRPTELTRLRWEQVKLDSGNIRLDGKLTKTGKTRNVRINATLRAWIETIPEDARTGSVIPGRWRYRATRVRKEAGLDGRELQDALRHSYGSYMLATENDLAALQNDMGHQHQDVFFNHYHNALTAAEAAPYWEVLPSPKGQM